MSNKNNQSKPKSAAEKLAESQGTAPVVPVVPTAIPADQTPPVADADKAEEAPVTTLENSTGTADAAEETPAQDQSAPGGDVPAVTDEAPPSVNQSQAPAVESTGVADGNAAPAAVPQAPVVSAEAQAAATAQKEADEERARVAQQEAEERGRQEALRVQEQERLDQEAAAAAASKAAEPKVDLGNGLGSITEGLGQRAKDLLQRVTEYMDAMKPRKPITVKDGVREQMALYRAITAIINELTDDFQPAFTALLKLFADHREGVFSEIYVFRFFEDISLSQDDRKAFTRLLNLLKIAAPIQGRDIALKQVNVEQSLALGLTEPGRQRVIAFFGL